MNPVVAKVLKKTLTTSATVVGALFVVYFWNLDQKLMGALGAAEYARQKGLAKK